MSPTPRVTSRALALTLALTLTLAPPLAAAPPPPPPSPSPAAAALERGRLCWQVVDLPCAERELELAHAGREALPPELRHELLRLLAQLRLASDAPERARPHLVELVTLDPTFAPAAWPPAWQLALDEARRLAPDRLPPTLSAELPTTAPASTPLTLTVLAQDPSGLARCELVTETGARFAMSTTDGERFTVTLPPELLVPPSLAFHIEAFDRAKNGPARLPAGTSPHLVLVAAPPLPPATASTPITSRWWFWVGVVVLTAGTATALAFALADDAPATPTTGDLGVTLRLPGASP